MSAYNAIPDRPYALRHMETNRLWRLRSDKCDYVPIWDSADEAMTYRDNPTGLNGERLGQGSLYEWFFDVRCIERRCLNGLTVLYNGLTLTSEGVLING